MVQEMALCSPIPAFEWLSYGQDSMRKEKKNSKSRLATGSTTLITLLSIKRIFRVYVYQI